MPLVSVAQAIASVAEASLEDYEATIRAAEAVKGQWMEVSSLLG